MAAVVSVALAVTTATAVAGDPSAWPAGVSDPAGAVEAERGEVAAARMPADCDSAAGVPALVRVLSTDASSRVAYYLFQHDEDTLSLPDGNVFVGSESVGVGGRVLARTEYFLDCENGLVCLKAPVKAGEQAEVKYRYLPFYARSLLPTAGAPDARSPGNEGGSARPAANASAAARPAAASPAPAVGRGLRLRGTKTFSVELGSNREASLKQSLDMNVTGEITKGLELNAVLTDRDLPIQPEGRTESVRELDEIRVEMRSRSFSASFGDCELALDGASLVNVTRKLEGARVTGSVAGAEVTAAGSTLEGKWSSREFTGTEGKQGPYQLLTDSGAACVVMAGTERVWLDGVKLRRGEGADYWMDYGTGRLYFTNAHPMRAESRVRVEYEYRYGDYQKGFYALKAGRSFAGGLATLQVLAVSESDDSSPADGSMSDEDKTVLRELGDASSGGTTEGARYVGPGNGDYNLVSVDSLGVGVYEYASDGTGAYDVGFVRVGEGRGSYVASADAGGRAFYVYVGPNQAEYVPARALTAPAATRVGDVTTTFSVRGVEVAGELALSQADLNTLSAKDDGDNRGTAGSVSVKAAPVQLSLAGLSLGRVSFAGRMRSADDNFRTFGNLDAAFDAETWAAQDSAIAGRGQRRLELETAYSPVEALSFSFAHGRLASSSGLSASRFAYGSDLAGPLSLSARLERASSDGGSGAGSSTSVGSSRTVGSVTSSLNGLAVVPSASYYSEVKEQEGGSGLVVREAGAGLSSAWRGPLSVRIKEAYRVEYSGSPDRRTRSSDAVTHTLGVQLAGWRSVSAACEYSLRDLHAYLGAGDRTTELGRLSLSQTTRSGRVSYELNHNVTSLDADQSSKAIVYVGQNQGHYDSTGTYRGRGDYEVSITKLDASVLSSDAATSATLTLRPFKGLWAKRATRPGESAGGETPQGTTRAAESAARPGQGALSQILETLTSSSLFRSSGVLGNTEGVFGMLARPLYTERGSALRASSLIRQELEASAPARSVALRYLFEASSLLNNQYENVRDKSEERRNAVRLRSEPARNLTLEMEQAWRTKTRRVAVLQGAAARGRQSGTESTVDLKFLPVRNVELELYGSLSRLRDDDTGGGLRVYKASPSATYGVRTSTRARLVCTISSYDGDTAVLGTATSAALVEPYRTEFLFSLDHRAGEHLTFSTSVSSRRSTGAFVTDGRLEMRAHF
ncbi:MAG: hypothetical protein JW952_05970 [Candidatus Eisenbacteria bacterium]|nr:hypothetical protein [Candidatus Eisenbacteria bacterium]